MPLKKEMQKKKKKASIGDSEHMRCIRIQSEFQDMRESFEHFEKAAKPSIFGSDRGNVQKKERLF